MTPSVTTPRRFDRRRGKTMCSPCFRFRLWAVVFAAGVCATSFDSIEPAVALAQSSGAASSVQGKIAFTSNRDGNVEIYVMNADGTGVTRLTNSVGYDQDPAWSPDGTQIAFASTRDDGPPFYEIYLMNADGTGARRLTDSPASNS